MVPVVFFSFGINSPHSTWRNNYQPRAIHRRRVGISNTVHANFSCDLIMKRKFTRCVKRVRKTMKEGAAIAICTKTILFPRGRTIKSFSKRGLVTQKRRRA
jgi:hypothetical protein